MASGDDVEFRRRFGRRLQSLRKRADLTQHELAQMLPGSPQASQVARWERGGGMPSWPYLRALAHALDVTVADLFVGLCDG